MTASLSSAHAAQVQLNFPTAAYGTAALVNPGQEPGQASPSDLPDGLPTRGSDILMDALQQLADAQPSYLEAEEFYDGEASELFATDKVAQLLAKAGVNSIEDLNYAAVPVDAITEKLQIRAVTCSAGDEDQGEQVAGPRTISDGPDGPVEPDERKRRAERAQEVIDELRKRNQLDDEEDGLHLDTSKHGDCYLFVWPVTELVEPNEEQVEQRETDEAPTSKVVSVDMFVNMATTCRAFYDAENPLRMTHLVKQWVWADPDSGENRVRATLYFPSRVERWVTKLKNAQDSGDIKDPRAWEPYIPDGSEWPAPNPTGRVPFFHFRTARTYGRPEHKPAYGAQRLIYKLVSAHAVTIDYQSFPQRYALTNPKADEVLSNLIDPDFPEDEDDDPEGDGRSQLRADPSAVWKLPGISSVGQFAPADPQVFLSPLDRYIRSIAELCGIPLHRFAGFTSPPSGEALRVANEPLNDKASKRMRSYGAVWADAYEFALQLMGIEEVTVSVQWRPIQQAAGADDWTVVAAKINNGVPVLQALMEAGYPQDEVEKWLSDETGADLVRRVALLNAIGTAVQTLGAGVSLGVVSAEQVGGVIARVLGAAGEDLPLLEEPVELHPAQAQQQMELQNQMRGQQMNETMATQPGTDEQGRPTPPMQLPPMPEPPAPVRVGD